VGQRRHCTSRGLYFFLWKRTQKSSTGNRIFVHYRIVTAVKRVESVSDRMPYIVLRGSWSNTTVLKACAPTEEKSEDSKACFYKELEQVFDHSPKYHTIQKFY
jgi:hypothetical protein